jgi:hypothetical protein
LLARDAPARQLLADGGGNRPALLVGELRVGGQGCWSSAFPLVMAGLDPAIPIRRALRP